MRAIVHIIGDYDEDTRTYCVTLIASKAEVEASTIEEGDEVTIEKEGKQ